MGLVRFPSMGTGPGHWRGGDGFGVNLQNGQICKVAENPAAFLNS